MIVNIKAFESKLIIWLQVSKRQKTESLSNVKNKSNSSKRGFTPRQFHCIILYLLPLINVFRELIKYLTFSIKLSTGNLLWNLDR